jgi:adenylate kinase family enzyme
MPDALTAHIHILGASGSGTTTLGAALAERFGYLHLDTDSFYWEPGDPPFQRPRPIEERRELLLPILEANPRWVLTGSLVSWGDPFIPFFDLVIYLRLPPDVRLQRLRDRELDRYGADALARGGAMHETFTKFMEWASKYDEGGMEIRSRARHEAWLSRLSVPIIRIDALLPTAQQIDVLLDTLP